MIIKTNSAQETLLQQIETGIRNALSNSISSTADGGSVTTIVDSAQSFGATNLSGKIISIIIDGITYHREIASAIGSTITFGTLPPGVPASRLIAGSGDGVYTGELYINVIEVGTAGNDYTLLLADGTGNGAIETVTFENGLLTITSGTDGEGVPLPLYAGNIQTLINTHETINLIFNVPNGFTAGAIEAFAEAVPFVGGINPLIPAAGTVYTIWADVNEVTIKDNKAATSLAHSAATIGASSGAALAANANRKYALIINDSDAVIYLKIGADAAANQGIRLNAQGGSYEMCAANGNLDTRVINAISSGAGKVLLVTEGV